ncbi:MAG TPA: hypothetical protein VFC63_21580 [Blastocatellia bacterium]|nr:hypothetical protein [Blastocatellia bacterium]
MMKRARLIFIRSTVLFLLVVLLMPRSTAAQTPQKETVSPAPVVQGPQSPKLSPGAEEVAKVIGVRSLLTKLYSLPPGERGLNGGVMSPEALSLRQQITEQVLSASLEVDGVMAEIDDELSEIAELRSALESQRDKVMNINAIASIVTGGGLGVVSTALQFKNNTQNLGNGIGVAAGAASVVLSVLGLHQQKGGANSLSIAPNMLAKMFDRKAEFHSEYPDEVWVYLSDIPPSASDKQTRRQELIQRWIDRGHIEKPGTKKYEKKIDQMTSGASNKQKLSLDALADRAAMLSDVRTQISLMKRDMSKLMLAIRTS